MQRLRKLGRLLILLFTILALVYVFGPRPATPLYEPSLPILPATSNLLETYILDQERSFKLKPDNEARIVWANDSLKNRTRYAMVYLHGFSASQQEGNPVHRTLAGSFGCNLYLSRLSMHGIDTTEQLLGLTADNYWESAKQALAVGKALGEKVILIGTSTGGTQALQLAAAYPNDVAGLILLSPNIAINDPNAWLLNNRWGLQIARMVIGGDYIVAKDSREIYKKYWNTPYRLEAIVELQEMLETTMKAATFQRITQPLLLMYYYKDEENQDKVVRVDAMRSMFEKVHTPVTQKREIALPNTGDHVIGCPIKSGDVQSVIDVSMEFLQEVMKLKQAGE